jgi:hypothetical protein
MSNETITTFTRKQGKIVKIVKPRFVETGKKPDYSSRFAKNRIDSMIDQMKYEIDQSEKSSSTLVFNKDGSAHRAYTKSTFPEFLRQTKINTRKDFMKVLASKKGVRYNRLKDEAVQRLNRGFQNDHGFDSPDMEFRTKTGQVWDNQDVVFRKIRGRIVPIRTRSRKKRKELEEVPF